MIDNTIAPILAERTEAKCRKDVAWVIYNERAYAPLDLVYDSRTAQWGEGVVARRAPILDPYGSVGAVPADTLISVGFTLPCGTCGMATTQDMFLSIDRMRVYCSLKCKTSSRREQQACRAQQRRATWVAACRMIVALRQLGMKPPDAKTIAGILRADKPLEGAVQERLSSNRGLAYILMATDPSRDAVGFALRAASGSVYQFIVFSASSISSVGAESTGRMCGGGITEACNLRPRGEKRVAELDPSWWNDDWASQWRFKLFNRGDKPLSTLSEEELREHLVAERIRGASTKAVRAEMRRRKMTIPAR